MELPTIRRVTLDPDMSSSHGKCHCVRHREVLCLPVATSQWHFESSPHPLEHPPLR